MCVCVCIDVCVSLGRAWSLYLLAFTNALPLYLLAYYCFTCLLYYSSRDVPGREATVSSSVCVYIYIASASVASGAQVVKALLRLYSGLSY